MSHTHQLNTSASFSASNTPLASPIPDINSSFAANVRPRPHSALVPSEAALLQPLLRENDILPSSTAAQDNVNDVCVINNHITKNMNTISSDFHLFESDEASFDYPLFTGASELVKSLQQVQQEESSQQILQSIQQQSDMYQPHQQGQQRQQYHQHQQQTQQAPHPTPQTPSMDLPESYSRMDEPLVFDGYSAFLEGPDVTGITAVALNHEDENPDDNNEVDFSTGYIDSPFPSYLDTPFETPYLADFGIDPDHTNATQFFFLEDCSLSDGCGSSRISHLRDQASFSLFPELVYKIPAMSPRISFNSSNTIEPATLFMDSPALQRQHFGNEAGHSPLSEKSFYAASDSPESSLSSAPASPSSSSYSPALRSVSPGSHPKAMFDNMSDTASIDEEEEKATPSDSDSEQDDDDEYVPSRHLAQAAGLLPTSSCKRKVPAVFESESYLCSSRHDAPASTFKRVRLELAGPRGGSSKGPRKPTKGGSKPRPAGEAAKRFPCTHPGCELRFARLYNLRTHERTHDPNQIRPFVCTAGNCSKAFSRKHDLQRHQASVHQGERNFKCHHCKKLFSRPDGLRRHLSVKDSVCTEAPPVDTQGHPS
ncbi:hypothetical protein BX616_010290 [Lobosporangium transversale]|uniref:C2H2-type domain-containing protein n=1 Tax=Lobosporangium transversale TaxID=64571 RepID=A0A1Y2H364_9FUNG|nr:hypothetical protein BCR41DRAFT_344382 [Lobosporangium transversale]KAF9918081.1 hypothetical protein BX616_010290 [Lobosporangium transversale]ORZ28988.1 hypothetical protein BCR41DRAFT_344382 [Lobosporangium transversale]|eukprot:XP_021886661.1 hypothetical protein BCR41DRAFT_344382 [Lobosporangium transversale]